MEKPVSTGHPAGLFTLFFAEMWERFCYYGMRGLLVLYLIKTLMKGDNEAFAIYGAYTALVYAAPVLGGKIADKILGYRYAVILGGIMMAIGEFLILGGNESWLFVGMGTIIVGNGYFKANISSIVGKLYQDGDPRRDSGFTIFYMGINIGALLATTVCAEVGTRYGYEYGFALAGFGMIAGVITFVLGQKAFLHITAPPNPVKLFAKMVGPLRQFDLVILGSFAVIPILFLLLKFNDVVGYLLLAVAIYVIYSLLAAGVKNGPIIRDRMIALIILMFFNVTFWACFEQAGSSLTLFAERNVDRQIGSYEMGAPTTQFFNPAFIILFGSIFSYMWVALAKRRMNPIIPAKFGFGIVQLGLGYLVVYLGAQFSTDFMVPLWTIGVLYLLHTTGELFLSPIGLSMVTKLAPKDMTGTAMGAWFLSFAGSNYLAAIIAKLTGSESEGAEGTAEMFDKAASLSKYVDVYTTMGLVTVSIGVLLLILSRPINKLMHGIV